MTALNEKTNERKRGLRKGFLNESHTCLGPAFEKGRWGHGGRSGVGVGRFPVGVAGLRRWKHGWSVAIVGRRIETHALVAMISREQGRTGVPMKALDGSESEFGWKDNL